MLDVCAARSCGAFRLVQLPGSWTDFLEAGKGDASCLGPLSGLEKQRTVYAQAVNALKSPDVTRLVLVARAQASSLAEIEGSGSFNAFLPAQSTGDFVSLNPGQGASIPVTGGNRAAWIVVSFDDENGHPQADIVRAGGR